MTPRGPRSDQQDPGAHVLTLGDDGVVKDQYGWYVVHTRVNWWGVLWFGVWALLFLGTVAWAVGT